MRLKFGNIQKDSATSVNGQGKGHLSETIAGKAHGSVYCDTRTLYSSLFKVPSHFTFVGDGDNTSLLFVHNGNIFHVSLCNFYDEYSWQIINGDNYNKHLTRAEQLLQERMRQTGSNIKYDYFRENQRILLLGSTPQLLTTNGRTVTTFPCCEGALCLQACPNNSLLLAHVFGGDLYLSDGVTAKVHQLTFTNGVHGISAGSPPYIIQEEFDRYIGFLWQNTNPKEDVYRILYEEVNEEEVEVVHTFNPASQSVEDYFYPRPGKNNAKTTLKLLVLKCDDTREFNIEELRLSVPLCKLFPDCCEYLVHFGWMHGGEAVWIQLLNRQQTHTLVAVIDICSFVDCVEKVFVLPKVYILWEEKSSIWISVFDCLEFLPVEDDSKLIRFLWLSEASGYKHIHLVEANPPSTLSDAIPCAKWTSKPISYGKWNVLGSKVWVDIQSELVYFQANKGSPIEKHLFVIDWTGSGEPKQLTQSGFYHDVTLDTMNFKYYLPVFSNYSSRVSISIHTLPLSSQDTLSKWCGPSIPSSYTPPTFFTVKCETGEELYGVVYSPESQDKETKVPAILYVYGGPCVQFVTRGLNKHLPRIQSWRQHGYAVIMLDNRGTANRGVDFEAYLKGCMGVFEIQDQVLGVKAASDIVDYIDLNRVAITGWSYGGYLSLMAIAQNPEFFKVCVSGAPVTDWHEYDTAYTERYLGILPENDEAYSKSSVFQHILKFPANSGLLLLIHGLCDENVLFTHSAKLCNELVAHGKPHVVQFYSGERHGLRSPSALTHCDATIVQFLNANL